MNLPALSSLARSIQPFCRRKHCAPGEELLLQQQPPALYYLQHGAVEAYFSTEDTPITVALIGAGSFLGEIGFFDNIPRIRHLRVIEDSEILMLDHQALDRLRESKPMDYGDLLHAVLLSVCAKFRRIAEEREPLRHYGAILSTGKKIFEQAAPIPSGFLRSAQWISLNRIIEDFKSRFFNLSSRLQKDPSPEIDQQTRQNGFDIFDDFNEALQQFSDSDQASETLEIAWSYIFKEIFPYFMRSRFVERCHYKPKGYPGDFLMMEMIYNNAPDGDGKFGRLIDDWCLQQSAARAIRARRTLLAEQIGRHCDARQAGQDRIRILNLACGSNRELFDFLRSCAYTSKIEATCVDIDSDALQFTNQQVNTFPHNAAIRLMSENLVRWSLGKVSHEFGEIDLIYSSGLTDYLDDRLFIRLINRCRQQLRPGGVLVVGNFSPDNPDRMFMDHFLRWQLIYRTGQQLHDLFAAGSFGGNVSVISEENNINLFVVATKSS